MQSGDEITQIPDEFAPTELLESSTRESSIQPSEGFRWGIVRWGTVFIAATAIAQTGTSLFKSLVAPTFAHHIEQAQTSGAWLKISAMNQAQQVHFLDHGEFSEELVTLDLGIVSQAQYYDYNIQKDSKRSRRQRAARGDQQIIVSLALPRDPGLPVLWGAISAQASDPSEPGTVNRLTDSLICKKPAPPTTLTQKLRQQLQSAKLKRRTRTAIPIVPLRLECPPGFHPTNAVD